MTWQAPTYHSRVFDLLPAGLRTIESPRGPIAGIDWQLFELEPLDRELPPEARAEKIAAGAIDAPPEFVLRRRLLAVPPWNNNAVFWCDFCRVWRPAFALVDVEGFPADLTDGRKWACDGCRTRWFRLGKPADGAPVTKRKWAELMRDHQGAPQEFVRNVGAMPDADRTHFSV